MNVFKIAAGLACGILTLLFGLLLSIQQVESPLYERTVEELMRQEQLTSYQELIECFPDLLDIQAKRDRITHLNHLIRSKTNSPAPISDQDTSLQIEQHLNTSAQLREEIQQDLYRLLLLYTESLFY